MKKVFLLSLLNILVLRLQGYQEYPADNLRLTARGNAMNRTAFKEGKIRLSITAFESGQLQGLFEWDNLLLYGKAMTCGEVVAITNRGIEINFKGTFDCSNVGGWPANTYSEFEATIRWEKGTGEVSGAYRILGRDNLPEQFGVFDLASLKKSKNGKDNNKEICGQNREEKNKEINLFIDVEKGTLNGARPDFTKEQFQLLFPAFVNELEWSDIPSLYGVQVDYLSDYFLIEKGFGISTSIKLLGSSRKRALSKLGTPGKSGEVYDAFQMEYGTLIIFYANTVHDFMLNRKKRKKVKMISIHTTSIDEAINALCADPEICR